MWFGCILFASALCGCGFSVSSSGGAASDAGNDVAPDSAADSPDALACSPLTAVLRDFQSSHPDFEKIVADDRGMVATDLGVDRKPVYVSPGRSAGGTVSSPTSFDQWYRDVPGVNQHFEQQLPLTADPAGTFTFDAQAFFPLDGMGWPEELLGHNFHFTTEIHARFVYRAGERLQLTGDDDVFVFINHRLAIDLGGVHPSEPAMVDFDSQAGALGLALGQTYTLAIFQAERHTSESHFQMVTTIDCFLPDP